LAASRPSPPRAGSRTRRLRSTAPEGRAAAIELPLTGTGDNAASRSTNLHSGTRRGAHRIAPLGGIVVLALAAALVLSVGLSGALGAHPSATHAFLNDTKPGQTAGEAGPSRGW
jgi:hypothetical protein